MFADRLAASHAEHTHSELDAAAIDSCDAVASGSGHRSVVYLLVGLTGSGKSTYAEHLVGEGEILFQQ